MRALLVCAAVLAALMALATVLWLRGPSRAEAQLEHGLEPAARDALLAAQLAASAAQDEGTRAPVDLEALVPPAKAQGAARSAPEREAAAPVAITAELTVLVVSEEDGAPLAGASLIDLPWPARPFPDDFSKEATMTDEDGRATFHLPAGGTRVFALSQDDRELVVELAPGERRTATLRLRSRADLAFQLLHPGRRDAGVARRGLGRGGGAGLLRGVPGGRDGGLPRRQARLRGAAPAFLDGAHGQSVLRGLRPGEGAARRAACRPRAWRSRSCCRPVRGSKGSSSTGAALRSKARA